MNGARCEADWAATKILRARRSRRGALTHTGSRCLSRPGGTIGSNNALRLADAMQASALPVPSFVTLVLSYPAAHRALHSRLTHDRCRTASTGPRSGQVRGFLFHHHVLWKPGSSECKAPAGRRWLSSSESSRQRPYRTASLPSRPTCRPEAPVHIGPPQPPAPDPRPARPAPLEPLPPRAAQPAAAPVIRQAATMPNGSDRGGLAQVCLLPLNPSPPWATARDKLLPAHRLRFTLDRLRFTPAAPQVCLLPLNPSPLWATERDKLFLAHRLRFTPAAPPRPQRTLLLVLRVCGKTKVKSHMP